MKLNNSLNTVRKKIMVLFILCICCISSAHAQQTFDINTGNGNWTVRNPGSTVFQPVNVLLNSLYEAHAPGFCGQWVAPVQNVSSTAQNTYTYRLEFQNGAPCGTGTTQLCFNYIGADNLVSAVRVNNVSIPIPGVPGFLFNIAFQNTFCVTIPALLPNNTNWIEIDVVNDGGATALKVCGTINTSNNSQVWPQTTKNSSEVGDVINDVITDNNGNVYITGTFAQQTTLDGGNNPDITISTGNSFESAFIAKYDPCGDLLWESHTEDFNNSQGNAIALDLVNNKVYITGNLAHSNTTTNSGLFNFTAQSCGNSILPLVNYGAWEIGFVAAFDMSAGCLMSLDRITSGHYTDCQSIAVDQVSGDVFVGGGYLMAYGTGNNGHLYFYNHDWDGFINQYSASSLGISPHTNYSPVALSQISVGSKVNDLDYDEIRGNLWGIGEASYLGLWTSFFAGYETRTNGMQSIEFRGALSIPYAGGLGQGGSADGGDGIAVDDNSGRIFLTGTYSQGNVIGHTSFDLFSLGTSVPLNTSSNKSAYMICYDRQGGNHWVEVSTGESAWGKAVDVRNGQVCFAGDFLGNINVTSHGLISHNNPLSENHLFLTSYDLFGNPSWFNTTRRVGTGSLDQYTTGVAYNNDNQIFMSGMYLGAMDYLLGTAAQLTSTGGGTNGFILRAGALVTDGSFRSASVNTGKFEIDESTSIESLLAEDSRRSIYPNPNNGQFIIELEVSNEPTQVSIYTTQGQKVWEEQLGNTSNMVDLEGFSAGLYLVYFVKGNQSEMKKIVIE